MIKMELGMCSCFYNKLFFWVVDLEEHDRSHMKEFLHEEQNETRGMSVN